MKPVKAEVLGKKYQIEWVDELPHAGECSMLQQNIKIKLDCHLELQQDALLHEILHAIDDQLGLKCGERRVNNLATAIMAVMSNNPAIRKFIFGL